MVIRKASSMIELVIAIVIMGIAVMTLPLMLERTQTNNAFAMQQEAILAAKTQLGDIITYPWDDNSLQNDIVAVLDTNGDNDYNRTAGTTRRKGHVIQDKRRKFFNAITNPGDVAGVVSISDFNGDSQTLSPTSDIAGESTTLDYRFTIDLNTTVNYVSDSAFAFPTLTQVGTSNIKMITVEASGDEMSTFSLRAYSANIGESQLLRRNY